MKKLFLVIVVAMVTIVWAFAKDEPKKEAASQQGYYCPRCNVELREAYVQIGTKRCTACKGKGWYGYGRTREEMRRNGSLCDPCNYCGGKGVEPIKGFRWVCPQCQARYNIR